jgi:hypothetical protein
MYVLTRQNGMDFEVLAASEDQHLLSGVMHDEVLGFIEEVYSNDQEALEWLMPISDDMTFWADEDELTPVTYRIVETNVL